MNAIRAHPFNDHSVSPKRIDTALVVKHRFSWDKLRAHRVEQVLDGA